MSLKDDKQQNIQIELDFSSALTGEAREAGREETESSGAMSGTENPASTNRLMEAVCERENLKAALRQVRANKGSPGVDGMTVVGIKDYLKQHWPAIREQLLNGTYEPQPVRRVEIDKPDGGVRKLGIPTVLDRFIQQAVMQVLQRRWDRTFSDHSYGFRPGRSAHQAVAQAQQYIVEGHGWCVDLYLEKFFDRVNHDKLMSQIAKRMERGQQVFVGEWATRVGDPTPTLGAALGDAAFMIGMERNSDLVTMAAYAPLFVNVNPGGMQWVTDLIGYDTMNSYGSPTYQAQKIFSLYHGDDVVSITAQRIPTREWQPPAGRGFGPPPPAVAGRAGATHPAAQPAPGNAGGEPPQGGAGRGGRGNAPAGPQQLPMPLQVPMVFADATRDSKTGVIYVKVVNRAATPQQVHLVLSGITSVEPAGQIVTISGNTPADTNSITGPAKIVPVTSKVSGLGSDFTRTFAPYSINVLQLTAK